MLLALPETRALKRNKFRAREKSSRGARILTDCVQRAVLRKNVAPARRGLTRPTNHRRFMNLVLRGTLILHPVDPVNPVIMEFHLVNFAILPG